LRGLALGPKAPKRGLRKSLEEGVRERGKGLVSWEEKFIQKEPPPCFTELVSPEKKEDATGKGKIEEKKRRNLTQRGKETLI